MELYEAIGRRRSIRFLLPFRPVEPEKIQCMLEAARLASHWGNVASLRALVIERDHASQEVLDALPSPVSGYQAALAPVVIVWYIETGATAEVGDRLRELVDIGAVGYGDDKREEAETQLIPIMEAASEILREPGLGEVDCGQGIAQATLVATSLGLGTCCLGSGDPEGVRRKLGLPDTCRLLVVQTVGYPAEQPEAGGQRPRPPFEEMFHLNSYGEAFPRCADVVEHLEEEQMIQAPAPLPWREEELLYLRRGLDLKGQGLL